MNYEKLKIKGNVIMKKLKALLCMMLIFTLCACGGPSSVSNRQNEPSSWAEEEVRMAEQSGLLTDAVMRNIRGNITRELFCEMVVRAYERLSGTVADAGTVSFTDTANSEILKAANLGIVSGLGNGAFGPGMLITREQIAVMLVRLIARSVPYANITAYNNNIFDDSENISDWARPAVNFMYDNGFVRGVGGGRIEPQATTTCEQAVLFLNRVFKAYFGKTAADYSVNVQPVNDYSVYLGSWDLDMPGDASAGSYNKAGINVLKTDGNNIVFELYNRIGDFDLFDFDLCTVSADGNRIVAYTKARTSGSDPMPSEFRISLALNGDDIDLEAYNITNGTMAFAGKLHRSRNGGSWGLSVSEADNEVYRFSNLSNDGETVYVTPHYASNGGIVFEDGNIHVTPLPNGIINEGDIYKICCYKGRLYYATGLEGSDIPEPTKIYACDMNGSNNVLIADDVKEYGEAFIVDDILYYDAYRSTAYDGPSGYDGGITRIELNDLSKKKIFTGAAELKYCDGEYAYYMGFDSTYGAVPVNGGESVSQSPENDEYSYEVYLDGDKVYYISGNVLYERDRNGGNERTICAVPDNSHINNVSSEHVYYSQFVSVPGRSNMIALANRVDI